MARIIWFYPRPVYPPQAGGELRTSGLIDAALKQGHEVLLIHVGAGRQSSSGAQVPRVEVHERSRIPRVVTKLFSRWPIRGPRPSRSSLRSAKSQVDAFRPDIAIVSEPLCLPLAEPLLGSIPFIFDSYDTTSDLYFRLAASEPLRLQKLSLAVDARRIARAEMRLLRNARAVLAASDQDADHFRAVVPGATIYTVANTVATPRTVVRPELSGRVVLFVGTLNYPPNTRAVEELILEVMPRVREVHPDARLLVVGRQPPPRLRGLMMEHDSVCFREGPADLRPSYEEARCTVLPIRFGSGSRLKVFEALAHGLPIVATKQAVEGVDIPEGTGWLHGETLEDLVAAAVRLLDDPPLAAGLGKAGRREFLARLSWERGAAPELTRVLNDVSPGHES